MNWLRKLFCGQQQQKTDCTRHQWETICTHSSLSMSDQSGRIEEVQKCIICTESRGKTTILRANGSIESITYC